MQWAGHPNWFFRWSKHALPGLRHPLVPEAPTADADSDAGVEVPAPETGDVAASPPDQPKAAE